MLLVKASLQVTGDECCEQRFSFTLLLLGQQALVAEESTGGWVKSYLLSFGMEAALLRRLWSFDYPLVHKFNVNRL